MPKTFVITRGQVEYYHRWRKAPDKHAFLGNLHRHMLHIKVELQVFHDDREIEIIELGNSVLDTFEAIRDDKYSLDEEAELELLDACELIVMKEASCETIAYALGLLIPRMFGMRKRECKVGVLEDGENGAVWEAS